MTGDILNSSMLIFKKDLKSELRTRYVINSLLMFVLVTISVIRFALGDEKTENELLTGLLWISIFFSTSNGLSRTFVKEEEKDIFKEVRKDFSSDERMEIGEMYSQLFNEFRDENNAQKNYSVKDDMRGDYV